VLLCLAIDETVREKESFSFFLIEKEALKDYFFFCYKSHVSVEEMKVGIIYTSKYSMNGTSRQ
jgi:hypothetical protein